jgi:PKD repeat protein
MWDAGSGDFHIFRLNTATQSWIDTGVALDERANTRADTLWDAANGKLYVASHVFSESPASGYPGRLYRFSYNAATDTYTRDVGFPVSINNFRTETLVIAKDSTGQLWATWTQGGKVWVNATVCNPGCNDATWGTAFVPSATGTTVKSDDISSVIAFGGGKIGVMWSNQNAAADYFAVHSDSAPDSTWSVETALQGPGLADDHINLKTDASGRIYAAVKTSKSGSSDPLILLLARSTGGSWSSYVFGRKSDHHTRPILELDEANGILHLFATSGESGGVIYEKTSPTSSISFAAGLGTPVLKDASGTVNNATSTKQNVSPSTGLVVLGNSNQSVYFHQFLSLGGGGGSPLTAAFSATPRSGTAPLNVNFTDQSSGSPAPSSWAWDFQNDGLVDSNDQHPSFQYTSPGTYSVKLTVGNGTSSNSLTQTGYITVNPPGGGGTSVTYLPSDDAYVRMPNPDENTGAATTLRAYKQGTSAQTDSFLKFTVGAPAGSVSSAKLRLFVRDASPNGGLLYTAESNWSETTLTWNLRPAFGTSLLASAGAVAVGTWIELDVSSIVTGAGTYSFVLRGASSDVAYYDSEEAANKPQLVVTTS